MSLSKNIMLDNRAYYDIAKSELIKLNVIESCACERITRSSGCYFCQESKIYAMATQNLKKNYPDMNDFKLFHKNIKEIMNENFFYEKCENCEIL